MCVVQGTVYDVTVDIRRSLSTFGQHVGVELSAENKCMCVSPGFAHGFLVLSNCSEMIYKTTDYWAPEFERIIAWDDRSINAS